MGLISFIQEAGEKLFRHDTPAAPASAPATPTAAPAPTAADVAQLNATAGQAIETYIAKMGLTAKDLHAAYDGASRTVTVTGEAADQATREKIVLCCGNVQAVQKVDDQLTVAGGGNAGQMYTVVKGDTLSKISKEVYGTPNKYPQIFEANKPMLSDPDKIYPGQVLRIPPAG